MADARIPQNEKDAVKNYKNVENLLCKWDLLNPAQEKLSPEDIDKKLRKGEYKKDKKDDIISKLNTAIDEAKEATRLFEARTGGNQRGDGSHRYRVILYQALVANSKDW